MSLDSSVCTVFTALMVCACSMAFIQLASLLQGEFAWQSSPALHARVYAGETCTYLCTMHMHLACVGSPPDGVVWCGVVCRMHCYQMAMAGVVLHTGNASREGCVSKFALRVVCCAPVTGQKSSPRSAALVQGCPGDSLLLCLLVQLQFPQRPHHGAS